jgi:hypothetical protein
VVPPCSFLSLSLSATHTDKFDEVQEVDRRVRVRECSVDPAVSLLHPLVWLDGPAAFLFSLATLMRLTRLIDSWGLLEVGRIVVDLVHPPQELESSRVLLHIATSLRNISCKSRCGRPLFRITPPLPCSLSRPLNCFNFDNGTDWRYRSTTCSIVYVPGHWSDWVELGWIMVGCGWVYDATMNKGKPRRHQ